MLETTLMHKLHFLTLEEMLKEEKCWMSRSWYCVGNLWIVCLTFSWKSDIHSIYYLEIKRREQQQPIVKETPLLPDKFKELLPLFKLFWHKRLQQKNICGITKLSRNQLSEKEGESLLEFYSRMVTILAWVYYDTQYKEKKDFSCCIRTQYITK